MAEALTMPRLAPPLPILLAGMGVAAAALLPRPDAWMIALAAIILLGIPHGALDGEIARAALRPRFGATWFFVFSAPYLALFALVLIVWRVSPLVSLAGFLALSVWHFGREDAPGQDWTTVLFRGGLPIAVPLLVHPAATLAVFGAIAQVPLWTMPGWLTASAACWLVLAVYAVALAGRRGGIGRIAMPAALAALFIALPPLSAFAIYFVCVHAPAHTAHLLRARTLRRLRSVSDAWIRAVPLTVLTLIIGAALWPLYHGPAPVRLAGLTIQVLSALTLPHMLLGSGLRLAARADPKPFRSAVYLPRAVRPSLR